MFRSILQNLGSNAIKFTPYGGKPIGISATVNSNMVEICIQDHGIGMSKTIAESLFSTFNKTSTEGTEQEKGSGLGLLLVKDFVTLHGGTISIDSEEGRGSCFRFTLPAI